MLKRANQSREEASIKLATFAEVTTSMKFRKVAIKVFSGADDKTFSTVLRYSDGYFKMFL